MPTIKLTHQGVELQRVQLSDSKIISTTASQLADKSTCRLVNSSLSVFILVKNVLNASTSTTDNSASWFGCCRGDRSLRWLLTASCTVN